MILSLSFQEVAWLLSAYSVPLPPLVTEAVELQGAGDGAHARESLEQRGLIVGSPAGDFTVSAALAEVIAACVERGKLATLENPRGIIGNLYVGSEAAVLMSGQERNCQITYGDLALVNSALVELAGGCDGAAIFEPLGLTVSGKVGEALIKAYLSGDASLQKLCRKHRLDVDSTRRLLSQTDFDEGFTTGYRVTAMMGLEFKIVTSRFELCDGGFWAVRVTMIDKEIAETFAFCECADLLTFVTDFSLRRRLM